MTPVFGRLDDAVHARGVGPEDGATLSVEFDVASPQCLRDRTSVQRHDDREGLLALFKVDHDVCARAMELECNVVLEVLGHPAVCDALCSVLPSAMEVQEMVVVVARIRIRKGEVRSRDIDRFAYFSAGYLVEDPRFDGYLSDFRYAAVPNDIAPMWGIDVLGTPAGQHLEWLHFRDFRPGDTDRLVDMLRGR